MFESSFGHDLLSKVVWKNGEAQVFLYEQNAGQEEKIKNFFGKENLPGKAKVALPGRLLYAKDCHMTKGYCHMTIF